MAKAKKTKKRAVREQNEAELLLVRLYALLYEDSGVEKKLVSLTTMETKLSAVIQQYHVLRERVATLQVANTDLSRDMDDLCLRLTSLVRSVKPASTPFEGEALALALAHEMHLKDITIRALQETLAKQLVGKG